MCPLYSALKYSNGYKTKPANVLTFFSSSFLLQMALIKSTGALAIPPYTMRSFDFMTAAASSTETNFFLYASFQLNLSFNNILAVTLRKAFFDRINRIYKINGIY